MTLRRRSTLVFALAAAACGCGGVTGPAVGSPDGGAPPPVVLSFLEATVPVTYDYAALEAAVDALPQATHLVVSTDDLESARADVFPAARFDLLVAADGPAVADDLELRPFLVTQGGARLFVGVGYPRPGAAAIDTPVVHVQVDAGRTHLLLGAVQGAWAGRPAPEDARRRIDRAELRAALERSGPLQPID